MCTSLGTQGRRVCHEGGQTDTRTVRLTEREREREGGKADIAGLESLAADLHNGRQRGFISKAGPE